MINETFHKDGKTFLQVNKRTARKYFENGARIYLLPCNLRFNNYWQNPCPIRETIGGDFDNQCVDFMYYNCDNERGRYIHYFVELNKQ